jgi:hypothetical protein
MGKSLLLAAVLGLVSGAGVVLLAREGIVSVATAAERPPEAAAAPTAGGDAKVEVTKLRNGVAVWITATDPAAVERVQKVVVDSLASGR